MTEIVRIIGYNTFTRDDVLLRLDGLRARFGQAAVEEAISELLVGTEEQGDYWQLSSEVRRLSRALIGPPQELADEAQIPHVNEASSDLNEHSNEDAIQETSEPTKPVNAPRKIVLPRFREHLAATGEDVSVVPTEDLDRFKERGWMLPDLMIADEFIAVRRMLSASQRRDMQQWLEASKCGRQATRAWPRETSEG